MPEFQSPADIGNRALQHCGADLMDATLGFTEQSQRARAVSFAYGKLRRAELAKAVWSFACKRTALRPIDGNTLLLAPSLWSESVTYFVGSIVTDANGTPWESKSRNNSGINNQPGQGSPLWQPYFGPMTVMLYDSSTSYFAGELVYTAAGDGTYNVFRSLLNGNAVHPALPNQWSTDTTYFKNNVVQQFPAWSNGTTYSAGQGALYTDGNVYVSLVGSNIGNVPPSSSAQWAKMPTLTLASLLVPQQDFTQTSPPGTTPIAEWSQELSYVTGNFVMFNAAVYVAIAASSGQFPDAAGSTYWTAVTNGTLWMSLTDLNIGNSPANTPAAWNSGTTYAIGNVVAASDGYNYTSKVNANLNNNPANGAAPGDWTQGGYTAWTTTFTQGGGNSQWMQIGGAAFPNGVGLEGLNITYPLGSGPSNQGWTRNCYRLPANFLRVSPQAPKAGNTSWIGSPTNLSVTDWEYDDDYLVTWDTGVILYRFVTDVQDVTKFNDLFCEMLACSIGTEVAEPLTQSTAKLAVIKKLYDEKRINAVQQNAIEQGEEEPPLDDFLTCRL